MYNLFDPDRGTDNRYPIKKVLSFKNSKKVLNQALGRVIAHYQRANYRVPNDHLIYTLLHMLNVSSSRELSDYVRVAKERTPQIAKRLKLIHPTNPDAAPFNGLFYNKMISEYIIATEEEFDVADAWRNWKSLAAIKIHYHPFTDLSMGLCDGNYKGSEQGYAVFTLNISLLALQYRAWREQVQIKEEVKPSIKRFIHRYVIVNMLKRHYDIALMNRTLYTLEDRPVADFMKLHPLHVPDYDKQLDKVIKARCEILLNYPAELNEVYQMFDCVWFNTWSQIIRLPDIPPTRFSKWAIVLAHLPYIEHYLKLLQLRDNRLDRDLLYTIRRQLRYLDNSRGIAIALDNHSNQTYENVKQLLNAL